MQMEIEKPWENDPILPKDVIPNNYNLTIFPLLDNGTYNGEVIIDINLINSKSYIVLHQYQLKITNSELKLNSGDIMPIKKAFSFEKNEFWVIIPEKELASGEYQIHLKFEGSLLNKIVGFYRSSYQTNDGQIRYLVTTKFEPTYARRAFPCFDEPALKAKFTIRIVTPNTGGYFALSNMDLQYEEKNFPEEGFTTKIFNPTPPMATYLVCFIVCDFDVLDAGYSSNNTSIKLYARKGHINNTKHAAEITLSVLDYFSKYFNMDYPLPKLDLIAVPDFVSGAMENWGLITFRETSLLAGNDTTTRGIIQISGTVSHELAHMWFGDIVTMKWWDDLWLNEGFATFLSTQALQHLRPEMNAEAFFVTTLQSVLEDDAAFSSHPIIQFVNHPDQITEMFDSISYNKGSSVLRMIEDVNKDGFRTGVSNYLAEHKWRNARTEDLWDSLTKEYKNVADLPHMLDTWTKQEGYPLITINMNGSRIKLIQNRYLSDPRLKFSSEKSPFGYKWDVPIKYITSEDPGKPKSTILLASEQNGTLDVPETASWFKLNSKQVGFYRVNYTDKQWMNFTKLLIDDAKNIPSAEDRSNLIDDAFHLASSGIIDYSIPLNLINYLKHNKEPHFLPWYSCSAHVLRLNKILYGTSIHDKFKKYVQSILQPIITDNVWYSKNNDTMLEKLLKSALANLAVKMELPSATNKVEELFNKWLKDNDDVPSVDLRTLVYTYGMRGERLESNWKQMWSLYLKEKNPQEKSHLLDALTTITDADLIKKLLELSNNEDNVRSQNYFVGVLFNIALSPEGNAVLWDFVRNNWDYLVKRFTLNDRILGRLLPIIAKLFFTRERLLELESFIKQYPEAGAGAAGRKRALERVRYNIYWHETYLPKLTKCLNDLIV